MIIDGRKIALGIIERLKKQSVPQVFLAAFFVGDDKNSESFLKQKEKIAKELGVDFRIYKFPENISENDLKEEILKIVSQKECCAAIIQLPLPSNINRQNILNAIPKEKDIDVLSDKSLGGNILPPAVGVVEEILKTLNYKLETKKIAVVGLGYLVGQPISKWLKGKCAELYCLDIGSDLAVLKQADLVILGTGQMGLIKPDMVKNDALVIDFGYGMVNGKISGDFGSELLVPGLESLVSYTPTPGGTGPILVAKLFENFYKLN